MCLNACQHTVVLLSSAAIRGATQAGCSFRKHNNKYFHTRVVQSLEMKFMHKKFY